MQQYFDTMRGDAFSTKGSTVLSDAGAPPATAAAAGSTGGAGAAGVVPSLPNGHVDHAAPPPAAAPAAEGSTAAQGPFASISLQQQLLEQQQQQQQQGDVSLRVRIPGPLNASFTHSAAGRGLGSSVSSGSEAVQQHAKTSPSGVLNRIFGKTLSRQGSNGSGAISPAAASNASDMAVSARENSMSLPDAATVYSGVQRYGGATAQSEHQHAREPSHAGVSEGSSATKLKSTASTFMQRLTGRGSGMGTIGGSSNLGSAAAKQQHPIKVLQLAVRIGIASGLLPYGCDVSECAVKVRAKGEQRVRCCVCPMLQRPEIVGVWLSSRFRLPVALQPDKPGIHNLGGQSFRCVTTSHTAQHICRLAACCTAEVSDVANVGQILH
jgi:hypothetical protein